VDNNSQRPIWNIAPRLLVNGEVLPPSEFREEHDRGAISLSGWGPAADVSVDEAAGKFLIMRSGKQIGANFEVPDVTLSSPPAKYLVRFTDDAQVRWELDDDMHIRRAPDNDW